MINYSDEQLVFNYLNGDDKSFEILIKRYLKPIFSFVFRFVENLPEAEDITQEVFLKTWKNLRKFNQKKSFKTWIFTIAKNTCFDWLRKKKEILFSELEKEDFIENLADDRPLPDELFKRRDLENLVNEALEKLSPHHKMILLLRYNDHFTFKEIAEILEEPLNTVKSRHNRAIAKLKQLIFLKVRNQKN